MAARLIDERELRGTMNAREEMHELERLWQESPYSSEFERALRSSKWAERIRVDVVEGIRIKKPEAIEDGILFLEVSPRYFRSGYHKAAVARALKRAPLDESQKERLRKVVLEAVSSRVGPEFSEYARLAIQVANAEFMGKLDDRITNDQNWSRTRLHRLKSLCERHAKEIDDK